MFAPYQQNSAGLRAEYEYLICNADPLLGQPVQSCQIQFPLPNETRQALLDVLATAPLPDDVMVMPATALHITCLSLFSPREARSAQEFAAAWLPLEERVCALLKQVASRTDSPLVKFRRIVMGEQAIIALADAEPAVMALREELAAGVVALGIHCTPPQIIHVTLARYIKTATLPPETYRYFPLEISHAVSLPTVTLVHETVYPSLTCAQRCLAEFRGAGNAVNGVDCMDTTLPVVKT